MLNPFEFQQARVKQVVFKSRLRSVLYGVRDAEPDLCALPANPLHQWVEQHLRPSYPAAAELPQLDAVLRRQLARGQALLDQYRRGRIEEARAGLTALDADAAEIDGLLQSLEQQGAAA
ncbi:hypothetical protein GKZ68_21085 (plasmid) [Hymenobacter sp. BRD128]|uniref:hypothetical protein n=1 Tax=Hymenobacter sp. BRD128 TaxID=2675878 RepID=UPI001564A2FA|nr:hypothetical protein [Hymenobacter sp. BRD128]QKG59181.1 hypothetical protein GKZ68_21085 [Hymenobacter sp. BRD128]